jgi:nucleotide-binding universal stress UspA family protein
MDSASDFPRRDRSPHPSTPIAIQPRKRVVLVLAEANGHAWSIVRANKLSDLHDAELYVLAVMSPREPFKLQYVEREVLARVNRQLTEALGHKTQCGVSIRCGLFADEVIAGARELGASLVVLEPPKKRFGRQAARIARRSGVPVLVARESSPDEVIVAASDLSDRRMPVLERAANLGEQLSEPVILIHNLSPFSSVADGETRWAIAPRSDERARRLACLQHASQRWAAPVTATLLCDEANPTDAIVRTARTRNADLVIVGTHRRNWLARMFHRSVAIQVVNRVQRSVLVTPLNQSL